MTDVHLVVATYSSGEPLPRLLASLGAHQPDASVAVVDDASPGGAPAVPDHVRLIASTENRGFGTACNRGAEVAPSTTDYLAFLNPDVELRDASLGQLVAELEERPTVGIATGPVIDGRGRPVPSAWGRPTAVRAFVFAAGWQLDRVRALLGRLSPGGPGASAASSTGQELVVRGHVLGGAMVVRRTCFEQLGGFDEDFFLFWEDADLCVRASAAGWQVAVLPCTPIVHVEGTSSEGVTSEQRWRWYLDGARTYGRKHLSPWRRTTLVAGLRLGRLLRRRS